MKGPLTMILGKAFRVCAGSAAILAVVVSTSAPGNAQSIFFDWGSNETVNDSGRDVVRFDGKARVGELIVSFGDRRVYYIVGPNQALSYPIAVPREKSKWAGVTSVSQKRVSPSWTPTPEMIAENPRLPPWVPGGHPMNPLGTHALYLGSSLYRIHGTDAPWTIGTAASKGCVRMYNKDVQDLYPRVPVGTKVTVTYNTYKTAPLDSDAAQGLMASLNKGKKIRADDDVAAAADKATKKFRDGDSDSDDSAVIHKAVAKVSDLDEKDEDKKSGDDGEAAAKSETEKAIRAEGEDKSEPPIKKRTAEKRSVETGSVDKSEGKADNSEPKAAKPKSDNAERKPASAEDASAMAQRAMAAAERAAAAAERAAEAAERVSAAVLRQSAATKQAPVETPLAEEAKPLVEWPVVRSSGTP